MSNESFSWYNKDLDWNDGDHLPSSNIRNGTSEMKDMEPYTKKAILMVEMQLDMPELLSQVPKYIFNYSKQADVLKNQVVTTYSSQIEGARVATQTIDESVESKKVIDEQLKDILTLSEETKNLMKSTYPIICQISQTLCNVTATRDWLKRILQLKEEVTLLYNKIEEEADLLTSTYAVKIKLKRPNIVMEEGEDKYSDDKLDIDKNLLREDSVENLLDVQNCLHQLVYFKMEALEELKENKKELAIFTDFFSSIDDLDYSFSTIIQEYMAILTDMAYDDPEKVVMILRIVNREEAYEEKIRLDIPVEKRTHLQFKGFKNLLFTTLEKSIHKHFKNLLRPAKTMQEKLAVLSDIPQDIDFLENYMKPCFPPEYEPMYFFAKTYQAEINKQISKWLSDMKRLSNGEKLQLYIWLSDYDTISEQYFESHILNRKGYFNDITKEVEIVRNKDELNSYDEELKKLKEDFANECHQMGFEWLDNIIKHTFENQSKISFQRVSEYEPIYTSAPLDFFTSIQGLITSVQDLPDFVALLLDRIKSLLMSFASSYAEKIQSNKLELEFVTIMAMINDFRRSIDYINIFVKVVEPSLPPDYKLDWILDVTTKFEEEGFRCLQFLFEQIWNIIKDDFKLLFQKEWYTESSVLVICDTILDYKNDFETGLEPIYKDVLMDQLGEAFIESYLDQLIPKKTTLKAKAASVMETELVSVRKVFGIHSNAYQAIDGIRMLASTQTIEDESFINGMGNLLRNFPDFQLHIADNIISKCAFLNKNLMKELKEILPSYYKGQSNTNQSPTVFSRYKKREVEKPVAQKQNGETMHVSTPISQPSDKSNLDAKGKKGVFKNLFNSKPKKGINPLPGVVPIEANFSPTPTPTPPSFDDHDHLPEVEIVSLGNILEDELDLGDLGNLHYSDYDSSYTNSDVD